MRTALLDAGELERLVKARDRWLAAGLATGPADRATAVAAVAEAYAAIDLPPPTIAWLDSPLAGCLGSWLVSQLPTAGAGPGATNVPPSGGQLGDQLGGQLRGQLWGQLRGQLGDQLWGQLGDQLGGQLWDQLRGQLGDQLGGQLRGQLWDQLRGQLRGQLWGQLWDQLWDQLWGQLRGQLWDQLWDQLRGALFGPHDLYWLAFCRWPELELGVRYAEPASRMLAAEISIATSSGWWWPKRGVCILTERPITLQRDNLGRLHSDRGPAIAYPDGWDIHAWHGLRVPPDLIAGWDLERIVAEPNAELRRAAIEVVGWERFIADAGLSPVHEAPDPANPGQRLYLYDLPQRAQVYGRTQVRLLVCTNGSPERDGTRRSFGLTVPAGQTDAVAAAGWTYRLSARQYRQLARRT